MQGVSRAGGLRDSEVSIFEYQSRFRPKIDRPPEIDRPADPDVSD
jgi:hypothetical protein